MMRALVCNEYGPPESLAIEEWDDPVPGEGELVIDVAAAGINFPDVLSIAGKYQVKTPTPFIPGNEAAGIVSAVGEGVKHYSVGDKVIVATRGEAFAEKCVSAELTTIPLPAGLDFEQGAGFSVTYGTSYHALKQSANLQPGETVLVLGAAGGVGITAVGRRDRQGDGCARHCSGEHRGKTRVREIGGCGRTRELFRSAAQGDRQRTH